MPVLQYRFRFDRKENINLIEGRHEGRKGGRNKEKKGFKMNMKTQHIKKYRMLLKQGLETYSTTDPD